MSCQKRTPQVNKNDLLKKGVNWCAVRELSLIFLSSSVAARARRSDERKEDCE